jgi:hypothetical protein
VRATIHTLFVLTHRAAMAGPCHFDAARQVLLQRDVTRRDDAAPRRIVAVLPCLC